MKYIISEIRLNEFMKSYLESMLDTKAITTPDPYIIVSERPADENEDESWIDYMEYDHTDGRLWLMKEFLENFMDIFALEKEQAQEFISKWFEQKFDVEVNFVDGFI